MPHYRVPFFEALKYRLAEDGINLRVITGAATGDLLMRRDEAILPWADQIRNLHLGTRPRQLIWQPCLHSLSRSDLVIVEQASKLLLNYALLAWRRIGGPRVAFWGHGANLDVETASRVGEYIKRRLARQADWWFCYTEGTARIVDGLGVPPNRRTVVQNAVDTSSIIDMRSALTPADIAVARSELGIGDGPVAVALGSIYPRKRPEFLIEAADEVRRELPTFELIVIGDGPSRAVIDRATQDRSWLHPVGAQTGYDMVRYAAMASLVLNPGVVGLTVLDSFALGVPLVTCADQSHGPEIDYLTDGKNGLILPESTTPLQCARAVVELLDDESRLIGLQTGAAESASSYTLEEMVDRFSSGVKAALGDND